MAENRHVVKGVASLQTQSFSGPIPHPSDFAEYERVLPGTAERILSMAERESAFRHEAERKRLALAEEDAKRAKAETERGQWLSFILASIAFASAVVCAALKQPAVGGIIAGTTLVAVVSAIMKQRAK